MDIMIQAQKITGSNTWGFLAANLVYEKQNDNNKRYRVYTKVLSRSFLNDYTIFGNRKNSVIFVLPQVRENEQTLLSNNMKASSLKQTDGKKANKQRPVSSSNKEVKRDADTGRFVGMHKNLEKVESIFIPGYKLRG